MIPREILEKFKKLYEQDYHIRLTDTQALEKCSLLFTALSAITLTKERPLTSLPEGANNGYTR